MISDTNFGMLEGVVKGTPRLCNGPSSGKPALNVRIETAKSIKGEMRYFLHDIVFFSPQCEEWQDKVSDGDYIKVRYHLLSQDISVGEGEQRYVVKTERPVVDHCEVESR